MKPALASYGLSAALLLWVVSPASGQRLQYPSMLPDSAVSVPPSTVPPTLPGSTPPMLQGSSPPTLPGGTLTPTPPTLQPVPGPTATFEGTIQPPPAQWDPYATPGPQTAPLYPQDYYFPGGPESRWAKVQRLIQEVRLDYVWLLGHGPDEFGVNDVEINGTVAIPFLYNRETPLLVTPGFAFHLWEGPDDPQADLPPSVFDAYLQGAWNPRVTPWLGGELAARVGVYSDFKQVVDDSVRFMGKGMAVLYFSPSFKVKAGVWYLDRVPIKLLPAGGIVWTPNADWQFDILFPDPKISRRLTTIGNTEWWLYGRGEYGGGAWTVKRAQPPPNDVIELIGYNDIRFAVGLEFHRLTGLGLTGLFEVGVAFDREIDYPSPPDVYRPNTTLMLRGGLYF